MEDQASHVKCRWTRPASPTDSVMGGTVIVSTTADILHHARSGTVWTGPCSMGGVCPQRCSGVGNGACGARGRNPRNLSFIPANNFTFPAVPPHQPWSGLQSTWSQTLRSVLRNARKRAENVADRSRKRSISRATLDHIPRRSPSSVQSADSRAGGSKWFPYPPTVDSLQSPQHRDSLVRHSRLHTRGLATASRERQHHGFGDHREAETTSPVARADRSPSEVMLEHVIDPQLSASLPLGTRPADTGCWTFQSCQDVSCLLTEDFDLRALDSCIADAISGWVGPAVAPNEQQSQSRSNASLIPSESSIRNDALLSFEAAVAVQQKWYSNITPDISASAATGRPSQQDCVDEVYRSSLSHRLQARISDDELPSADFLNLCIKLYFAKFHPVFPVIHAPSFRPSSQNALTLLSICSMGALFVGSAVAAAQGRKIFQRLNKAILASVRHVF